jgi:hypothetical protein
MAEWFAPSCFLLFPHLVSLTINDVFSALVLPVVPTGEKEVAMRRIAVLGGTLLGVMLFTPPLQAGYFLHKGRSWYTPMPVAPVVPWAFTPVIPGGHIILQGGQDAGNRDPGRSREDGAKSPRPTRVSAGVSKAISASGKEIGDLASRINKFTENKKIYKNLGWDPVKVVEPEKETSPEPGKLGETTTPP